MVCVAMSVLGGRTRFLPLGNFSLQVLWCVGLVFALPDLREASNLLVKKNSSIQDCLLGFEHDSK